MSWTGIILLIVGVYLMVKAVQGIRDFVQWTVEERKEAREIEKLKAKKRQAGGGSGLVPKDLRVRAENSTRSSRPDSGLQDRESERGR